MEDYEKKYKETLNRAKKWYYAPNADKMPTYANRIIKEIFPELKESKDETIRKEIIEFVDINTLSVDERHDRWIAWLEKQGKSSDQIHYWTEEEIEPIISDYLRGVEHYGGMIGRLRCLTPKSLEKQCYTKKDVDDAYLKGISDAKNELEKQGKKQPIIVWHSINEEPEEMKELFCEWESDDATWHDVAFYDKESHTFRHAKMPINVTKWIYVDELLEKQGEQKPADKNATTKQDGWLEIPFGAKDSELQEATYYIPKGFHAEIDDDKVVIKKGEKSAAWGEEDKTMRENIEGALDCYEGMVAEDWEKEKKWLKSLKNRIGG